MTDATSDSSPLDSQHSALLPTAASDSSAPPSRTSTVGRLNADDLGRKVSLVHDGVLVIGSLQGVDHTLRYGKGPQAYLHIKSTEGWRWGKFVDADLPVQFHEASS